MLLMGARLTMEAMAAYRSSAQEVGQTRPLSQGRHSRAGGNHLVIQLTLRGDRPVISVRITMGPPMRSATISLSTSGLTSPRAIPSKRKQPLRCSTSDRRPTGEERAPLIHKRSHE